MNPSNSGELKSNGGKTRYIVLGFFIAVILLVLLVITRDSNNKDSINKAESSAKTGATLGANFKAKSFTNQQFRDLYNDLAFPNTKEFTQPPEITGNKLADEQIQNIATQRGYVLRSVAREPISQSSNSKLLQDNAVIPWEEMKKAAANDGVNLYLLSGYRSVEEQREILLDEINKSRLSVHQIANGSSVAAINKILARTAPPGYSRHHTGFTIDISCPDQPNFVFANTSCYKWLSDNNYQEAISFGWIPSYPENTENQGPEPESWEYVWVGLPAVSQ